MGMHGGILKKARGQAVRTRRSPWIPSRDKQPMDTKERKDAVRIALKSGSAVLEIEGKFFRVPLNQKLTLQDTCRSRRVGKALERYQRYNVGQTVGEVLKLGALLEDLPYDRGVGLLKFVPALKGALVKDPLPRSQWPPGIRAVSGHAPWWLPANWAHGVKTTCKTYLPVFIAPDRRRCYHQEVVEAIVNEKLGHSIERMADHAKMRVAKMTNWDGDIIQFDPDQKLFAQLSKKERACLPGADELHFCVVSARRATELSGIRGIVAVQSLLRASGAYPRWYVDEESRKDYQRLGLDAVVGGKLTPSRNKALTDAAKLKKACVQVSDDITGWEFYKSDLDVVALRAIGAVSMLAAANKARSSSCIVVSPMAAARFLLAKMRATERRPRLGGVLPTGNGALAMLTQMTTLDGFILGDFFVHDSSPCRFDEAMTLKEDYDFTCSHLDKHGCVMRCNRLVVKARHEKNPGGAVDSRDSNGQQERRNIRILMRKWKGVFKLHSRRGDTQVKMKWTHRK